MMMKEKVCSWCDGLGFIPFRRDMLKLCPHCSGSGMEEYFYDEKKEENKKQSKHILEERI
ncbi:hypothetical protein IJD44_00935 [bacterium]|nr:hypothetical protein [bacterium]